jgi:hypothetical protein
MGLRKFIKTLRKNHAPPEKTPNESGLLSDLRFRSDKSIDGSLPSNYRTDFGKPSLMETDSLSEDSQHAVVPNEFDDLGPVKLASVEKKDFVDWLNDDSASAEVRPQAIPTWAHSQATFEAWPDDLSQKFEPLSEANEERSDAILSQTIESLHLAALSQKFEHLPNANEGQSDSVLSQTIEPLPDAREEQSDVVLPQKTEPQSEASKEQSDDVESQKFEPLSETHEKPSVTDFSLNFEPLAKANINADQSEVVTLRQHLKELSSILPRTNEEEGEMEDDYLLFDAVETPDDSLLHPDDESDDLPCKADKKQGRNIVAVPEEIPLLKVDVASGDFLLDADEEARNALHQVGEQHNNSAGHADDNVISYEIDEGDNSIVELDAGEGPRDSHLEDDKEPVDPLLGVVVESDHPRFADAKDNESSVFVGLEEASDSRLGTDAIECESLLDNDDGESLLDEDGEDSLLDAEEKGCVSLLNLDRNRSDLDSLAELLDSGTDEQVRCGWCEDAVVKTTVEGLKGLADHFQRESSLLYPEYLMQTNKSARGKKTRGLQAATDDRETRGKKRAKIPSPQHDQSDSLHSLLSGSHEKDSTIKTVDSRESGSRSAASSLSVQTDANSAKSVPTAKGNDIDEVRGVDKELNNVALRSDDMRPPRDGGEELSSPRSQSVLETRETPSPPMFFAPETPPPPPTTIPPRRHGRRRRRPIVKVVPSDATTSTDVHAFDKPQLPTLQQEEDASSIKTDWATMHFYLSQPPPPPPPRGAPSVMVKPERAATEKAVASEEPHHKRPETNYASIKTVREKRQGPPRRAIGLMLKPGRATEKAVASEEPHHKRPESNYSSIKTATEKRQDQQRPISRALQRRSGHMDVKTDHATMKTSDLVKSVPDHRRPGPPCDDRNDDTFTGREEMCPIARMRFNSQRRQLV